MNTKHFLSRLMILIAAASLILAACAPSVPLTDSKDPVTVVRNFYDILNTRDVAKAMELTGEDYVMNDPFGTYDRAAAAVQWQAVIEAGLTFSQTNFVDTGNGRVTSCYEVFEHGKSIDMGCGNVTHVRDGKIIFDGLETAEQIWVVQQYYKALNTRDIERAMSYVAEDALELDAIGMRFEGAEKIRGTLQSAIDDGVNVVMKEATETDGRVVYKYEVWTGSGDMISVAGVTVVANGRIIFDGTEETWAAECEKNPAQRFCTELAMPALQATPEPEATLAPEPTAVPALEFVHSIVGDPNPLSKPVAVALDAQDNLYVLEAGSGRLQVFDPNGQFLRTWGSPGEGDGQFRLNHPNAAGLRAEGWWAGDVLGDISIDSAGNVYVLDSFNRRVQKFSPDGMFLGKWGTEAITGTAPDGQFRFPSGIATDGDGNVYVSDGGRADIQKFDSEGNFLAKIGETGISDGQFNAGILGSLIVNGEGDIYIADFWSDRVQIFGPDGQFRRKWGWLGMWGIAMDAEGNIYTTLSIGDALVKFDPQGQSLFKWGERGGDDGQFRRPMDVAIDSKGLIYVADYDNNRVQVFREP